MYTYKRDQYTVFVEKGQGIAPNGLLAAIIWQFLSREPLFDPEPRYA
jgi:hypothetical protein